jgi:hypothetical protein
VTPVAGDAFTLGGQLVGNNRGSDAMGVGVCFGNGCNHGHIDDNPQIDASGRELVRLDITSLVSNFNSFTIGANSATAGELLGIFAGNARVPPLRPSSETQPAFRQHINQPNK